MMRYKQHLQMLFLLCKVYRIWAEVTSDIFGRSWKSQYTHYSSCVMLRMPLGAMVSSPDQTPQVPFMFFLIIHYFERPAPSVRLVKSIHLRACCKYWISREHQPNMACHTHVNMTGHLMYKICNYSATVTAVSSSSTGSCAA